MFRGAAQPAHDVLALGAVAPHQRRNLRGGLDGGAAALHDTQHRVRGDVARRRGASAHFRQRFILRADQAGTVIGTDAFYFKRHPDRYDKWHTCGRVIIEDHVDIGAGCTINRGVSGDTVIGAGSKLDCLIHIGHGAVLGKRCLLAGQVGVGGKAILEDGVVLYGQVGVAHGVRIGAGAVVSAKSGVSKDLEGGKTYFGAPAEEIRVKQREMATLRMLSRSNKKD